MNRRSRAPESRPLGRGLALVVLTAALLPWASRALEVTGQCSVKFFASSTLHDFEGSAPCSLLEIGSPDTSGAYRARAEVTVQELDTGISARDEKMRAMFDAERHPRITATFAGIDPGALRARRADALPFRISIRGFEREVRPAISGWTEQRDGRARFRADFDLSLAEFGLEAPVAMGFMRVDDRVRVVVDVDLTARER
jgi:hypothetical protein